MNKFHPAYRIPLFLFLAGLVGTQLILSQILMLGLGLSLLLPSLAAMVALPILWVIARIKKWKKTILWSQVPMLSIVVCYTTPSLSVGIRNRLYDYQLDRLQEELNRYKAKKGRYPQSLELVAPPRLAWGIRYESLREGRDCRMVYDHGFMCTVISGTSNGAWKEEHQVD